MHKKSERYETFSDLEAADYLARELGRGFTAAECLELLTAGQPGVPAPRSILGTPKSWHATHLLNWLKKYKDKLLSQKQKTAQAAC